MSLDQACMLMSALCIILAAVLAWFGKDGWGLVAILGNLLCAERKELVRGENNARV